MGSPATSPRHFTNIPPSPTASYASTAVPPSTVNLPSPSTHQPPFPHDILSRADVAHSISSYENLLATAKVYRKALSSIAAAASQFGAALEACARCKGTGPNGHGILNASGLQYLIGSNTHILGESIYRGFEVPLLHELDLYKEKTAENEESYKSEEARRGKELRKREGEYLKLARQKRRNFSAYRTALTDLTLQIDDLDKLKYEHYRIAHTLATDTSNRILDCAALVVRAELEIFEKIAQKGWDGAGGGLDDLVARAHDPFASEMNGDGNAGGAGGAENGALFSILPAHSILPSPHSPVMGGSGTGGGGVYQQFGGGGGGGGGNNNGKYRALTDALSSPSPQHQSQLQSPPSLQQPQLHHLLDSYDTADEDERSIFSGGFSSSTLDTVTLNGGARGGGDSASSARNVILPPPMSPSASSAGWGGAGGAGEDDIVPLELDSPVGVRGRSGSTSSTGDGNRDGEGDAEAATIRGS
ncbi:hypothetical protein DFH27DRAFT_521536 [Peziza echinospora]|nr:hypothetical protein DFH27DRAFT_521536 [Peziza echinospora]